MIYPAIDDLTLGKYNRYTLIVATAKCARLITEEYVHQRERAEKLIANKETDKSLASMITREYRDDKAVKNAINKLYRGEYRIIEPTPEQIAEFESHKYDDDDDFGIVSDSEMENSGDAADNADSAEAADSGDTGDSGDSGDSGDTANE